jgi:stage III sporulation protein AB
MVKIFGIILILLSGSGIGFKASDNLVKQNKQLKKLNEMLVILRGEIKYNYSIMPQAFRNVSRRVEHPFSEFLINVADNLDKYEGKSVAEVWEMGINNNLESSLLSKKHLEKLKDLGKTLGFLDMNMQLSYIDILTGELSKDIEENTIKMKENCKLYRALGIMGGILTVLIIA